MPLLQRIEISVGDRGFSHWHSLSFWVVEWGETTGIRERRIVPSPDLGY